MVVGCFGTGVESQDGGHGAGDGGRDPDGGFDPDGALYDMTDYLFDDSVIRSYYLEIPPESFAAIDAEAVPDGCVPYTRSYYPGSFSFEGEQLDGVGIRVKGGCGSARNLDEKAALKVHLSWDDPNVPECPTERRVHGEKRFTFNNMVEDPSYAHERLGYALYRRLNVPTPRVAHVLLHVNGELWGLYLLQEAIDRRFLERWFSSKNGMLYEGVYGCDLLPESVPPTDEDDSYCLERKFEQDACTDPNAGGDPLDFSVVRDLVQRIDSMPDGAFYPQVEAFFDFDAFLSLWAVDSIIANWDGYVTDMNNYRAYHDPDTDRWSLIPTGIDMTFTGDYDPWDVSGILAWRCMEEPECEAAFAARLGEAVDTFEEMALDSTAAEIYAQIRPHVLDDPRREVSELEFEQETSRVRDWIRARAAQIRQSLSDRGY